jgi:hypothetical protein
MAQKVGEQTVNTKQQFDPVRNEILKLDDVIENHALLAYHVGRLIEFVLNEQANKAKETNC